MRFDFHTNISKELLSDVNFVQQQLLESVKETKYRYLKKYSIRLFFKKVQFYDQHADLFMKNLVTARTEFVGYRIPRIIKKLLTKT